LSRRAAAAGVPAILSGALGDGTDQQVAEHPIWLRDTCLRDPLYSGMDDERRRVLPESLRGEGNIAGEAPGGEIARPLRGVGSQR